MQQRIWWKQGLIALGSILLLSVVILGLSAFGDFRKECEAISEQVFRLHVLANSDTEADQNLKLQVRDAILAETEELFASADSKAESMAIAEANRSELEAVATRTLRANGSQDRVSVQLEHTFFNTRTYGDVTIPAGWYDALQVRIGSGEGHNWWCVLFPSLCLPSATGTELEQALDEEACAVTNQSSYDIRFRIVEWYEWLFGG